ncbi:MAG TPA: hypothetical protein VHW44_14625 [Pseudonocardiaceae bacterium]|jgi:hypothetical protein|nr:hypothetical protein [Pseudonocardiaceae bacterium]
MSTLATALIINVAVLFTTLEADLGTRKISNVRLLRPVLVAAVIIPLFLHQILLSGTGLVIEVVAVLVGLVLGALAASRFQVSRDHGTGRAMSRAGWSYALIWTAIMLARTAFSYGMQHWFGSPVATWLLEHSVAPGDIVAVITNGLIFMAVAMMLTRTLSLAVRRQRLPQAALAAGSL